MISLGTISSQRINPPVGRIFTYGSGSGYLEIDGSNVDAPWNGSLLPDDRIRIVGGIYSAIGITNIDAGGTVYIENDDNIQIRAEEMGTWGTIKGVTIDFTNRMPRGLMTEKDDPSGHITLDWDADGFEDLTIRGVDMHNIWDRGIDWKGNNIPYNNGAGRVAIKNLTIEDCSYTWEGWNPGDYGGYNLMSLTGVLAASGNVDTGFIDGLTIRRIIVDGGPLTHGSGNFYLVNVRNAFISKIDISGMNHDGSSHVRFIVLKGQGIMEDIKYDNSYGNSVQLIGVNRVGSPSVSVVRNTIKSNPLQYSTVEVNNSPSELDVLFTAGIEKSSVLKVLNCMLSRDAGAPTGWPYPETGWQTTCVDIYGPSNVVVKNCLATNPFETSSAIYGPTVEDEDNVVYASQAAAGITDLVTLRPNPGSPLIGAGTYDEDVLYDFYGDARPNPPSIGPVEPA